MAWNSHRLAPAPGSLLCNLDAVPEGACHEVKFGANDDAFSVIVYRTGAEVRAWVNNCPHFSLPLNSQPNEFLMLPGERVMCAYHCAVFRLSDGFCTEGPAQGMGLDRVPIEVAGNDIRIGGP
jgi:nitrite reductase/ring-hydroxylating ferredoxin subunit